MTAVPRILFAQRIWQWGNSIVFALPKLVREALNAKPNDLIIMRIHPPYVTFRVARPESLLPIDTFEREDLPPVWPGKEPERSVEDV